MYIFGTQHHIVLVVLPDKATEAQAHVGGTELNLKKRKPHAASGPAASGSPQGVVPGTRQGF